MMWMKFLSGSYATVAVVLRARCRLIAGPGREAVDLVAAPVSPPGDESSGI